ncbi:hypothetical protein JCM10212_002068 [Sporobolomyces blumeae]
MSDNSAHSPAEDTSSRARADDTSVSSGAPEAQHHDGDEVEGGQAGTILVTSLGTPLFVRDDRAESDPVVSGGDESTGDTGRLVPTSSSTVGEDSEGLAQYEPHPIVQDTESLFPIPAVSSVFCFAYTLNRATNSSDASGNKATTEETENEERVGR